MRRLSLGLLFVLMFSGLFGCGKNPGAEDEGLVITKDGTITSTLVEPFDNEYYDLLELLDMIQLEIGQYNQDAGTEGIVLNSLEMVGENCVAVMTFQSPEDYALYNEIPFFAGTVQEAVAAGVDMDVVLTEAGKNETIGQEEIEQLEAYQLVVWYGDMPVEVPGKIRYHSEGLQILGSKRVVAEDSNMKETEDGTSMEETTDASEFSEEELAGPFYLLYK